jgi:anti-sigma-K factor RskA
LNGELGQISGAIEGADSAPGEQVLHAWQVTQKKADTALGKWNAVKSGDLAAVNTQLKQANLPEISTEAPAGGRGGRGGRSGE